MRLHLIVIGLLSFFASILIFYVFGSFLSIEWLQYDMTHPLLSAGFWTPLLFALIIGFLIARKYRSRLQ
ncbi:MULTISPECIES: hypothetical protein [Bacillaceae]|uniref:Uncharacterized protein n=1 Tax=Ectobacillus funiculus TaxID=137993 RepID=A0ABV5WBK9_9BACI|nr:hypothetical protein [Ectobacillus funiculus]